MAPRTPRAGLVSDSPEDESERVTKHSPSGEPSWQAVLSCTGASRQVRRTEVARRQGAILGIPSGGGAVG